jgi:hypothetical protein
MPKEVEKRGQHKKRQAREEGISEERKKKAK